MEKPLTVEQYLQICEDIAKDNLFDAVATHFPDKNQIKKHQYKFPWDLSSVSDALSALHQGNKAPACNILLQHMRDRLEEYEMLDAYVLYDPVSGVTVNLEQLIDLLIALNK